jgi:hypothetical protein
LKEFQEQKHLFHSISRLIGRFSFRKRNSNIFKNSKFQLEILKLHSIRLEIKTILFFTFYIAITFFVGSVETGSPHGPGFSSILFLLLIPISIVYTLILFFKYFKSENKEYLNCVYIISGMWILFYLVLEYILI